MNLLEVERENSLMDFEQYGTNLNLKNWPFDTMRISPCIWEKVAIFFCTFLKSILRTIQEFEFQYGFQTIF